METRMLVCWMSKRKERLNKILFINALNESPGSGRRFFLTDEHIGRIAEVYRDFKDI